MSTHPAVKQYLIQIGSKGGRSKSARKQAASRLNGAKRKTKNVAFRHIISVDGPKPLGIDLPR